MTTENRRFRLPRVFLAALGLALALPLSAAASTTTAVGFFSTAPASVDATANDVAVMYLDMTATDGTATLSYFQLSLFGDVAPGPLKADMWRDNGDLQFSPASDLRISSVSFQAVGGGFPPAAMLTMGETLPSATPRRYYVSVNLAGLPPGRRISFGFLQPAHFQVTGHDATFPMQSAPTVVR